jgi:ferric-dicitrate binding protein FerR (iron transport regulator)
MNTKQLIQKFWAGYASTEDKQQLLNQLERKDSQLKAELKDLFDRKSDNQIDGLTAEQKKRVYDNVIALIGQEEVQKKRHIPRLFIQIAASLLLVTGAGWGIWKYNQELKNPNANVVLLPLQKRIVSSTSVFVKHLLPDGTIVTLSPHSSLTYNPHFTDTSRMLSLSGKGKFDVAKDKHRPFTVIANGVATTALGTIFIIDGNSHKETNIHLVEGSIRVIPTVPNLHAFPQTVLRAGEQIVINNTTQQLEWKVTKPIQKALKQTPIKAKIIPVPSTAPSNVKLNFEKENLKTVFAAIAKTKQIAIICEGIGLSQLSFTGAFEQAESIENMLSIICGLNELEYRKEQSTYFVSKKNNPVQ